MSKKRLTSLERAAEAGNPEAQDRLGYEYDEGKGGHRRNYRMAAYWYARAAEQNLGSAQNSLGIMYANGLGVKKI